MDTTRSSERNEYVYDASCQWAETRDRTVIAAFSSCFGTEVEKAGRDGTDQRADRPSPVGPHGAWGQGWLNLGKRMYCGHNPVSRGDTCARPAIDLDVVLPEVPEVRVVQEVRRRFQGFGRCSAAATDRTKPLEPEPLEPSVNRWNLSNHWGTTCVMPVPPSRQPAVPGGRRARRNARSAHRRSGRAQSG